MNTKIICIVAFMFISLVINAQTPIFIPDTLTGTTINLTLHRDSVQRFSGNKTQTLAFNQYAFLGPTLILNKGQQVSINVTNQSGDTSTLHWHGLHVAPSNDGGPHTMIMDGMTWTPQFTVLDQAATYWYHPHFHGKTAEQTIKGAAGIIIVRDNDEAALNIPRRYGLDDFPIIVQSAQFDDHNQPMPRGMQDSTLLVNGTPANNGSIATLNIPAQVVRLRLLNASGERTFNFGLTNNRPFKVIASDDGLLAAPVTATRIRLAPGERYQILIDATNLNGQTINLMSYASELPMGVQGGPTMPMPPGSPPMDSPLNGIDFNVLQLNITPPTINPITSIPATLIPATPLLVTDANTTRTITFSAQNIMSMDGPFYLNGNLFNMERIDYHIPLNNIEVWTVFNQTMIAHPFHLHDVPFYLLDRDGNAVSAVEQGRKDVVLIESQETIRFITKFDTFADSITPYMFHCHILMHEDDGMMGQFVVMPPNSVSTTQTAATTNAINIYPNPATNLLYIDNLPTNYGTTATYQINNTLGQIIATGTYNIGQPISISSLRNGLYQLTIYAENNKFINKFIKQ
jgi:blue copper oxidase